MATPFGAFGPRAVSLPEAVRTWINIILIFVETFHLCHQGFMTPLFVPYGTVRSERTSSSASTANRIAILTALTGKRQHQPPRQGRQGQAQKRCTSPQAATVAGTWHVSPFSHSTYTLINFDQLSPTLGNCLTSAFTVVARVIFWLRVKPREVNVASSTEYAICSSIV